MLAPVGSQLSTCETPCGNPSAIPRRFLASRTWPHPTGKVLSLQLIRTTLPSAITSRIYPLQSFHLTGGEQDSILPEHDWPHLSGSRISELGEGEEDEYQSFGVSFAIITACVTHARAQSLKEVADRIIAASESNTEALQNLQYLSDWIGPRLTGSEQAAEAVEWAAGKMRKDGLENVRLQPVTVPRWVRGTETGELLSPSRQKMPLTGLGGTVGTPPEGITAEVVGVSTYDELAELGRRGQGEDHLLPHASQRACVIKVGFVDCVVFSPVMRSAGMPSWNRYARYAP